MDLNDFPNRLDLLTSSTEQRTDNQFRPTTEPQVAPDRLFHGHEPNKSTQLKECRIKDQRPSLVRVSKSIFNVPKNTVSEPLQKTV